MDKQTKQVIEAALRLPDLERSVLLDRLFAVLEGGDESQVFNEALALADEERWDLVAKLQDSLAHLDEDPYETVWGKEIERRDREFREGRAQLVPWSEVKEGLKRARAGG